MPDLTQNVGLRKPIGSDPFTVEDFRHNYEAIDAAIGLLRQGQSNSGSGLTKAQADGLYAPLNHTHSTSGSVIKPFVSKWVTITTDPYGNGKTTHSLGSTPVWVQCTVDTAESLTGSGTLPVMSVQVKRSSLTPTSVEVRAWALNQQTGSPNFGKMQPFVGNFAMFLTVGQ